MTRCAWVLVWLAATGCRTVIEVDGGETRPASCEGLPANCGASGTDSCCESPLVPGGTFLRGYDGVTPGYTRKDYPATVSDFRLDRYEITVGRFRHFVAAYDAWRRAGHPAAGEGAHPVAAGTGWDATWNASLPPSAAALASAVQCNAGYQTWTPGEGANETRPMNCIDWFQASAFCAWDGGRLPTEAEWHYAASGGEEQRVHPWGAAPAGPDATLAVYGCYFNGGGRGTCRSLHDIAPVGSAPKGNGRYGQADLAGNLVEWMFDGYWDPYPMPCDDCAPGSAPAGRGLRGGGFLYDATGTVASSRTSIGFGPERPDYDTGARCARAP